MSIIKKSALCAVLLLFANTAFAKNTTELSNFTKNKPQSIMTITSADFSFDSIDEMDGRVLVRGGVRARRVSLRR